MTVPMLIFVIVYMAMTVAYLFSETSGVFKRRAINKIALASLFLIYAIVETIRLGNPYGAWQLLLLAGIVFCYIGDVWLLWSFTKGGIAFSIGNVIIFIAVNIYLSMKGIAFSSYWFFLLIFAVLIGGFMYLVKAGWFDMNEGMKKKFPLYIISVTLHGTLSIAGLFFLHDTKSVLLFVGLILFMISDYFISLHKFKYKESKAILRCNSFSYFTGLMLAALSFSF